jgi:type VI protein secretion system component Hcp
MTDVVVVSDSVSGNSGTAPGEQFNLSYSSLQIEYRPLRPDGTYGPPIITCWDFVAGTSCS